MNLLAFETSTSMASVTLVHKGKDFSTSTSLEQKKHTEFITSAVENLLHVNSLQIQDIDQFAVSIGPGSFTGLRVSINAVRTYAQLLNKSVVTENSLRILASQTNQPCVCLLNAYKNMVYVGIFENAKVLCEPTAIPIGKLSDLLEAHQVTAPILFIGDGFTYYQKLLVEALAKQILRDENLSDFPSSESLARLTLENSYETKGWKSIIPLYIRASEAEESLKIK